MTTRNGNAGAVQSTRWVNETEGANRFWVLAVGAMFVLYVGSYPFFTEVYRGKWGKERLVIRLFHNSLQMKFWEPLLRVESMIRPDFSGQVRSGA